MSAHPTHSTLPAWLALTLTLAAPMCAAQNTEDNGVNAEGGAVSAPAGPVEEIEVIGTPRVITPLPGLGFSEDDLTTNIQTLTADDIRDSAAINATQFLNEQLKSITVSDGTGNVFQQEVNFRGFSASPLLGTPQGVSVYIDGVRINESLGEVVNWDLIPLNAIEGLVLVPGATPLFGLNTLAGALSVSTKSGFTSPGLEAAIELGSWDRSQMEASVGVHDDHFAAFLAFNRVREDGWRVNSPSEVNQFFGRGDFRSRFGTLSLTAMTGDNRLVGNGTLPFRTFEDDPSQVFTAPDVTNNRVRQFNVTGTFYPSEGLTLSWLGYRRDFTQSTRSGDVWDDWERTIDGRMGYDCEFFGSAPGEGGNGFVAGHPGYPGCYPNGLFNIGETEQASFGTSIQLSWVTERNQAVFGYTFDRYRVNFEQSQQLGFLDENRNVVVDPNRQVRNVQEQFVEQLITAGLIDSPDEFRNACVNAFGNTPSECAALERRDEVQNYNLATAEPVIRNNVIGRGTTSAAFFYDALNITPELTFTFGVRHTRTHVRNQVQADLPSPLWQFDPAIFRDQQRACKAGPTDTVNRLQCTEEDLVFSSWNPSLGLSYSVSEDASVQLNYSRGTRAPSAIELACARPPQEDIEQGLIVGCTIATNGIGDPPLKQVRSTSYELGGNLTLGRDLDLNLSAFRTDLENDILFLSLGRGNRGVFDNFGQTRRTGVELGLEQDRGRLGWFLNYTYLEATFETEATVVNASNSTAVRGFNALNEFRIDPGDRLPGIPRHALRAGIQYDVTPRLTAGLRLIAQSSIIAQGNENNDHRPVGNDEFSLNLGNGTFCDPYPLIDGECFTGGRPFVGEGRVAGFWVLNLDVAWRPNDRTTLALRVENLLDRQYATAGALGFSPFQRSGANFPGAAVDAAGFNHNSFNWRHDLFVGPGAPRAAWVTLRYAIDGW